MPIDISKLADRLKQFETEAKQSEATKYLWKPKEGVQTVRIVPSKHNPDSPFVELMFYYKLAGKTYLAPCTFGKPDPIQEFVQTLRSSGVAAQRELAKKLEAKPRTYAPVIVRGEEERGVRYWGFGVTVYKQLLKLITNPKWGDITSLTEGNDIEIEFHKESKKKGKDGKSFPETNLTPDPRKTPVVDVSRADLIQKIKDQVDINSIWPVPEYDELKSALDKYANPDLEVESGELVDESEQSDEPTSVPPQSSSSADIAKDLGKAFDEFFSK